MRGYGGMVDTTDLKSVDLIGREGSSPSTPTFKITLYNFITQFFGKFSYNLFIRVSFLKLTYLYYVTQRKSL